MSGEHRFQTAYIPIGVPTFHLESARRAFADSLELLRSSCENLAAPEDILLSPDALNSFLEGIRPDLIVLQNATFANAAYTADILHRFPKTPILLWTLREPVIDGGRLRLNSLTGAYSAANTIRRYRDGQFPFMYGSPEEPGVQEQLQAILRAAEVRYSLKDLTLAQIGHTPQGFGFGRAMDMDMLKYFGVHLLSVEARELIDLARSYSPEDCDAWLTDAGGRIRGLDNTPEKNRLDFARLYKAYDVWTRENHVGALASRCWPDFFTAFGTPVCAVLGILNDLGIAAACEADAYGALSMYIGQKLSGSPVFFGDPVSLDETENTLTFWHCGTAACSLAREDTGAAAGEHCNRHIGPTLEFGCRPSRRGTIFRIGQCPTGGFRFLIETGEILDRPQQFYGTSLVFRPDASAEEFVHRTVRDGWEPHFTVVYWDVSPELRALSEFLNIPS